MDLKERLAGIALNFAGVTPEKHEQKAEQYRVLAKETEAEGDSSIYEALNSESAVESVRLAAGTASTYALTAFAIDSFISAVQDGDVTKGLLGAGLLSIAVRTAIASVRAADSTSAIQEVINEGSGIRFHQNKDHIIN